MNFELTKTEQLFRQMIREFAENEVKPLAAEIDEQTLAFWQPALDKRSVSLWKP